MPLVWDPKSHGTISQGCAQLPFKSSAKSHDLIEPLLLAPCYEVHQEHAEAFNNSCYLLGKSSSAPYLHSFEPSVAEGQRHRKIGDILGNERTCALGSGSPNPDDACRILQYQKMKREREDAEARKLAGRREASDRYVYAFSGLIITTYTPKSISRCQLEISVAILGLSFYQEEALEASMQCNLQLLTNILSGQKVSRRAYCNEGHAA